MATRSMYEVEDVVATIFHGLMTKQSLLVIQAARELRVSLENELLLNVVSMAWLLCDPYTCPMTDVPTNESVYQCLCLLIDHFPSELPKYKPQLPVSMPSKDILETTIQTCFDKKYAKQCIRIMTMLLHKQPELCYSLLEKQGISKTRIGLFDRIVYTPLAERLLQHLVIQTMFSISVSSSTHIQKYSGVWNSETVGCSARTFSIPLHALSLWNLKPKPATRIQNSLVSLAIQTDSRSMYWQSAGIPTDETMDTWYTTHFPDDIPDEWSRSEIEKSHVYSLPEKQPKADHDWQPAFLLCWS